MLRYSVAGVLLVAAASFPLIDAPWYFAYMIAAVGVLIIIGNRRILRADVTRPAADEVMCRFAPWYEGYIFGAFMMLPGMGVAILAATSEPSNPAWFSYGGWVLLLFAPLFFIYARGARRRAFIQFTPSSLSVHDNVRGAPVTKVERSTVESITARKDQSQQLDTRQVAVSYRPTSNSSEVVTIGLPVIQLTVEPDNLLHAVEAWKEASPNETGSKLMDRIEAILRGRPGTGQDHQHWTRTA